MVLATLRTCVLPDGTENRGPGVTFRERAHGGACGASTVDQHVRSPGSRPLLQFTRTAPGLRSLALRRLLVGLAGVVPIPVGL